MALNEPDRGDADRVVQHGVVSAVGAIGLATLASRILGYARDIVIAHAFGAGPVTDAFFVAFRVPNLLRRLLAEGALSTSVVPVFSASLTRDGAVAFARMVRAVAGAGLITLSAVSLLGIALAPIIVAIMAPGWRTDPALFDLAVQLTRVMFPYLLLVGLAALAMGVLNAHHRFFTAALSPVVLNVAMIASVLVLSQRVSPAIMALAVGVLAGGLGQFAVQLPEVRRVGVPLRPALEWSHPAVRDIASRLWPAAFSLAAVQVTVVVNTLLASLLPSGTVSYLYYADRVMEFPLGVFGIALATAALPSMAAQAARRDHAALRATVGFALRLSAFIAVPAAVGLAALSGPIVRLLFQRGEFGAAEAALTAQALVGYAVGLPAFSATRIAAQTFYALGDVRTPVYVGFVSVAANVMMAIALMWPLEHVGLALASSLSSYVNLVGLCWLLHRRQVLAGDGMRLSLGRTLGASSALLVWCVSLARPLEGSAHAGGFTLLVLTTGALVYVGAAAALRAPELGALLGMLRRRRHTLPSSRGG
ncbi:MAG: murein biosynthesis integral membrane protein MurJ [Candidatus Rokuibacteriota bacterium]|nr:MAG: murein biosynthesis integral membrane protein MurJ [Candidatus Rokubacteria bacterium]